MNLNLGINKSQKIQIQKVLYVEDNHVNLRLIEKVIKTMSDFVLISAMDGKSGLDLALKELPDIIILDINIPGMDGYEVLKALRENAKTKDKPIVALTSNASKEEIKNGLEVGFTRYITKPIDISELKNALQEISS